jgi:hypothetical protein
VLSGFSEVSFLGHVINQNGITVDPKNVDLLLSGRGLLIIGVLYEISLVLQSQ